MPYHPLSDPAGTPRTVYDLTAPPPPATAPLIGARHVDVAVVGAGFTGLSAALHLAQAGARVAVLEANEIGWGASGRNFGQVVPYLRHEAHHALHHFGPERGERLVAAAAGAPDLVFGLIAAHGMDCQARQSGLLFAAHTEKAMRGLEARAALWSQRGVGVSLLDADQTRAMIGGGAYPGGLFDPRGGTVNPLAYARGLAAAAIGARAEIFTQSRVTRITRTGGIWMLETAGGAALANAAVLATDAYTDDIWPGLRNSIIALRIYQLASLPLPEPLRRAILPKGQALTDTRRLPSGVRLHADGRLHVSTGGPAFGAAEKPDTATPLAHLKTLFPDIGTLEWDYAWSGWIAMTPDEYPRLHALAPGLFAGIGYSGRGIGLATVLGRDLARLAGGAPANELSLPVGRPHRVGIPGLNQLAVKSVMAYRRLRDAGERRGW